MREWTRLLTHACRSHHIKVTDARRRPLTRLAALLALVGPVRDAEAEEVYWALVALFMNSNRAARWDLAIDAIPPTAEAVKRVAAAAMVYQQAHGTTGRTSLQGSHFKLDQVTEVMSQISNPKVYVELLKGQGFNLPGAVFHPNTLKQAKKTLRGALSPLGQRSRGDHLEQIKQKVRRVT